MLKWHERLFTKAHQKKSRDAAKSGGSTHTGLRTAETDSTAHVGTGGHAVFPFRLVLLAPEREHHSCSFPAYWLPSNCVEYLSDVVNLDLVDLWQIVTPGLAGLESAHVSE